MFKSFFNPRRVLVSLAFLSCAGVAYYFRRKTTPKKIVSDIIIKVEQLCTGEEPIQQVYPVLSQNLQHLIWVEVEVKRDYKVALVCHLPDLKTSEVDFAETLSQEFKKHPHWKSHTEGCTVQPSESAIYPKVPNTGGGFHI